MFKKLTDDIDSMMARDPAARSRIEVFLFYPGLHALAFYRLANALWRRKFYLIGRFVSQVARILTGIEIHPGARIGKRLFIDHGMGVVIGETSTIGDDVTLYHGVTLGGTSWDRGKRHPTVEDGVVIGAGAQILGPITVGAGARIGSNAVVLADVPKGVTMVGIPARSAVPRGKPKTDEFSAYGILSGESSDPVARVLDGLLDQVSQLSARVEELEGRPESRESGTDEIGYETGTDEGAPNQPTDN